MRPRMRTITHCIILSTTVACLSCGRSPTALPDPPIVRSQRGVAEMTLTAARASDGHDTFVFDGREVPPAIHVTPGDTLRIHYVNALPRPTEAAAHAGHM